MISNKEQAQVVALEMAIKDLKKLDIKENLLLLGMNDIEGNLLNFRAYGKDLVLNLESLEIVEKFSGDELSVADSVIILHYFSNKNRVVEKGNLVPFREFTGGQFYYGPFRSRSVNILEKRFGNKIESLKENLARWDFELLNIGDLSAKIHIVGNFYIYLIYRLGDDEFPANADILFDAGILNAICAEDAAVTAGRIAIGLL